MSFWKHANIAIREADIVAEVLDARMPELSRNHELEEKVREYGKELVFVLNKSDLVTRIEIEATKKSLGKNVVFVSGKKNLGMRKLKEFLIIMGKRKFLERAKVCFVGYPNVGKSSVINALVKRARAKVSSVAGTTKGVQWVTSPNLKIIDSPGVIPFDERNEGLIALLGSRDPQKLKRPEQAAIEVIRFLRSNYPLALELSYGIKNEGDEYELLEKIARFKHFLLKGAEPDFRRASITLVREWQLGKMKLH